MMAATTANTLQTSSSSSSSSAGDSITSNREDSNAKKFAQSMAQLNSSAPKQKAWSAASECEQGANGLAADESNSEGNHLAITGSLTQLNEQSLREGGAFSALQSMQQKPLADSQLNEMKSFRAQGAVSAIDASNSNASRAVAAAMDVSESKSQLAPVNTSLSQREPLSTAVSELLGRHKVQVAQESKASAVTDVSQFRTASQELNFKAELAMNSNNKAEIGQRLVSMLSDKITLQASSQANKATIRLDPPELGKIDLTVTLDRDRLSVQINTTNASVREAITQTVERLRAELVQENFLEVTVNVGNDDKPSSSQHNHIDDDALTHIASNLSTSEEQAVESSEQQQEIIARV